MINELRYWYLEVLNKYTVFSGRASRREYWMFVLANLVVYLILVLAEGLLPGEGWLTGLYSLFVLVPSLAVGIRRLHDTDRSGWWLLVGLIPVLGFIVLLIFMIQKGQTGDNQYGPDPRESDIELKL